MTLFLDLSDAPASAGASAAVERFFAANWPFGRPYPEVYYDPRTLGPDARTSLHAKCVVADERLAFVSSANFTGRGHTRNIEAGVLVEDALFAEHLARQWRGLVESGLVHRHNG